MPQLLTNREVAALLRVNEPRIYELVADRASPASRAKSILAASAAVDVLCTT